MTTKHFYHRVLWLLIPLLTLFNTSAWGAVTLTYEWTVSAGRASLPSGVTHSGLGSDYAAGNAPYYLKFDTQGDYLQINTDAAAKDVKFMVKMLGGNSTSKFKVQGCTTASGTYSDIEEFTCSGSTNDVHTFTTTNSINTDYRYFRIIKSQHGSNVGFGYLKITKAAKYTVRFYTASGVYSDLTEESVGGGVTPPGMSTPCDGWAFQGWSTSYSNSTTSTTVLSTVELTAGKYYPTANATLYPVYTKTASGGTAWTKMTTNPVAGDIVILVSEGSTVEGKDKTQSKYITSQSYTGTPSGLLQFTVEAGSPSGLSFKNGSDYLQYNGSNNELNLSTTKNNKSSWTVSVAANGTATITNVASTSRVIKYNSGSPRFACYTSGQNAIQLYKETETIITYYYSYPTCCTPLGTINGSFW